jgi:hypothetical protein
MLRRMIALVLCAASVNVACASAGGMRLQAAKPAIPDRTTALLAEYVKQLPIGSRIRVDLADGHRLKGTLMKTGDTGIVIRPHTRLPEPPLEIALDRIAAVDLDTGSSVGKTVAIGVAAGVGGVLAFFAILAAIFAGD